VKTLLQSLGQKPTFRERRAYRPIEFFTTVMVIYFLLIFPVTRLIDRYHIRVTHLGRS
jgi:polar amino acid transport system permease protein